eukprot:CAMPEP_0118951340 /NCGR_PEP_ID=MMETSP1169-20130426/52931_1 /TAXON_ID=36882 /ORGANISM="Pyramimonas obovata, Strain CCMP722" /LENGTH=179 /DNA_ID=CAMNT_0006898379 /DNA_START=173 /DNA_END=709 /DNA_ORIENTATION=+
MSSFVGPASTEGAPQGGVSVGPSGWISSDADPCASSASESEEENTIEEQEDTHEQSSGRSILTKLEVVRRRRARIDRLKRLYQHEYWLLLEKLRVKHRRYFFRRARVGSKAADPGKAEAEAEHDAAGENDGVVCTLPACEAANCAARALPLAAFCMRHIALQSNQCLYLTDERTGLPRR